LIKTRILEEVKIAEDGLKKEKMEIDENLNLFWKTERIEEIRKK
jgi:hypothetical protein